MSQNELQINAFKSNLDRKNSFSVFRSLSQARPAIEASKAWRDFYSNLTTPVESLTKDIALFGPYKLMPGTSRSNRNVLEISALTFDIDYSQGYSFEDIIEMTGCYSGVIHTTWSHTIEEPRYRLIINLLHPIAARDFQLTRDAFLRSNPKLNTLVDKACSDISRAYYLFSYPPERANIAQCCVLMGAPLNPSHLTLPAAVPAWDNQTVRLSSSPFQNALQGGFKEGQRNQKLASFIGGLINAGHIESETLTLAMNWNLSLQPPLEEDEVTKTNQSIWKTHMRNHPDAPKYQDPMLSKAFKLIPAGQLLQAKPPAREWVINEFLPKKIVAAIIAAGGTGKSFLAMHIAVSAASGTSLFGKYLPTKPTQVVFISGEDDKTELQRRLHKVTNGMSEPVKALVSKNLHFIDFADSFELFTQKMNHGDVSITDTPLKICEAIKSSIGVDIGAVIIDPISRFRGGEENLAADTTRFVQALQQIRDQLNTTVLTLHHVNKGARTNGATQNNARGSSAFIDGVRLVYELNTLTQDDLKKVGNAASEIRMLQLQTVKSNYGKPIDTLYLLRRDDGALELQTMLPEDYLTKAVLQELKICRLTKTQFKESYGDAKGKFGLAEKTLIKKLEQMERSGLIKMPERAAIILTNSGEKMLSDYSNGQ